MQNEPTPLSSQLPLPTFRNAKTYDAGTNLVLLDPDVRKSFGNEKAVLVGDPALQELVKINIRGAIRRLSHLCIFSYV